MTVKGGFIMPAMQETKDTILLLKECDAGTKMAVKSLRQVLDDTKSEELHKLLTKSLEDHEALGNKLHDLLNEYEEPSEEPSKMSSFWAKMMTDFKMMIDYSDHQVASLMIDGCNMGIKSLSEYVNQYKDASQKALDMCTRLITIEQDLMDKLRLFL